MSNPIKLSALAAGLVLAFGIAPVIVRADTTPPTTPPATPAPTAPKVPHYTGSVTAVDTTAATITIKDHKGTDMTFTTTTDTKIHVNRKPAALSDIQVGFDAHIKSEDGKVALEISAGPHVERTKPAVAPAPAPAPAQ